MLRVIILLAAVTLTIAGCGYQSRAEKERERAETLSGLKQHMSYPDGFWGAAAKLGSAPPPEPEKPKRIPTRNY